MKSAQVISAGMLVLLLSCNKSVEPPTVAGYEATAGSTWSYSVTSRVTNIRILVPGTVIPDTSLEWTVQTMCEGTDTLHDSVQVVRFRSVDSDGYPGIYWYRPVHDTLFLYAYAGLGQALPKRSPAVRYRLAGRSFSSAPELVRALADGTPYASQPLDSIVYEARPPKTLVFPLRGGLEWTFRERGYPVWLINKKVTGSETVTAGGASLPCYVIAWFWDFNNDGMWDTTVVQHDYYHSKGLLKRTTLVKDIMVTSASGPDTPLALLDMSVEYLLRSTNVQ